MAKKPELTLAGLLYMLLVLFIHAASECVTGYNPASFPFTVMCSAHRLSSFVVQGFLFLSAVKLFLPRTAAFSYGRYYASRARRILLPYLLAFSLFCVYFVVSGRLTFDLSYFFRELLTGGLVGHFYYVALLCQFDLLVPLWRFLANRCSMALTVFTSLLLMLICRVHLPEIVRLLTGYELTLNSRLFSTFLFYFVCGIFCGKNYERFTEFLRIRRKELAVLFAGSGAADCVLIWVIRNGVYYPTWADDFHVLYCTSAILFTLSCALLLAERKPELTAAPLLRLLSGASYNVYLIHPLFLFLTDSLLNRAGIVSLTGRFLLRAAAVYVVSIGVCIFLEVLPWKFKSFKKPSCPPSST
ncbi:MAG: acyltransferase [Eubacteriales bacterium]